MGALEITRDDYEAHILDILNIKDLGVLSLLDISSEISELEKLNKIIPNFDVLGEFRRFLKQEVDSIEFKSSYQKFFILVSRFKKSVEDLAIKPKMKEAEKFADTLAVLFHDAIEVISFQIENPKFSLKFIKKEGVQYFSDGEIKSLNSISGASKFGRIYAIRRLLRWNEQNELKARLMEHYELILMRKNQTVLGNISPRIKGFLSVGGM